MRSQGWAPLFFILKVSFLFTIGAPAVIHMLISPKFTSQGTTFLLTSSSLFPTSPPACGTGDTAKSESPSSSKQVTFLRSQPQSMPWPNVSFVSWVQWWDHLRFFFFFLTRSIYPTSHRAFRNFSQIILLLSFPTLLVHILILLIFSGRFLPPLPQCTFQMPAIIILLE